MLRVCPPNDNHAPTPAAFLSFTAKLFLYSLMRAAIRKRPYHANNLLNFTNEPACPRLSPRRELFSSSSRFCADSPTCPLTCTSQRLPGAHNTAFIRTSADKLPGRNHGVRPNLKVVSTCRRLSSSRLLRCGCRPANRARPWCPPISTSSQSPQPACGNFNIPSPNA